MYQILNIYHRDGTPRTDGRYPARVGSVVEILSLQKDAVMFINYVYDGEGNPKTGVLRTSTVESITETNFVLKVFTKNSIYELSNLTNIFME